MKHNVVAKIAVTAIILLLSACKTSGHVINKPHWVDERGISHYAITCASKKDAQVIDMGKAEWDRYKIGDAC